MEAINQVITLNQKEEDQMNISRSERELGGTGQPGKETNGFGGSVMNRLVSLLYKFKLKCNYNYKHKATLMGLEIQRGTSQFYFFTNTNQLIPILTDSPIQVGDFGWGPGFPSDDPEHRCAFHYYGDHHGIYFLFDLL